MPEPSGWLPSTWHSIMGLVGVVIKCLSGQAPEYLKTYFSYSKVEKEGLHSAMDSRKLIIPRTYYKTFADRSYSVYGPQIWNALLRCI